MYKWVEIDVTALHWLQRFLILDLPWNIAKIISMPDSLIYINCGHLPNKNNKKQQSSQASLWLTFIINSHLQRLSEEIYVLSWNKQEMDVKWHTAVVLLNVEALRHMALHISTTSTFTNASRPLTETAGLQNNSRMGPLWGEWRFGCFTLEQNGYILSSRASGDG